MEDGDKPHPYIGFHSIYIGFHSTCYIVYRRTVFKYFFQYV